MAMSVCAQTPFYCATRSCFSTGGHCPYCATAALINELRTTQSTLEARIADLESDLLQLRKRMADLEHRTNDRQAAHNAAIGAAGTAMRLATRCPRCGCSIWARFRWRGCWQLACWVCARWVDWG